MEINYEFACQDDCFDKMAPSDLRQLVCERDQAYRNIDIIKSELEAKKEIASECYNKMEDALVQLEALREQLRWRDVRDELPEESEKGDFLVFINDGRLAYCGVYSFGLGGSEKWSFLRVTHWMPLPTPPTSQSNKD